MKYRKLLVKCTSIFLISLFVLNISPVYAENDPCDEAYLRDIGAAAVSCVQDTCNLDGSFDGNNTGITSDGTVWKSGIQPPYIMEQFAVETLKAIAQKRGVPATDTVTQEHIDALLAFMWGEGGDISNRWLFNPLNTGLKALELIDGPAAGNGTQSFKSFDAGVEATARTMVGKNQSRLADTLIQKDSTAQQFMFALTFYNKYPGNKLWAEASVPNPGNYYSTRMGLVNQVRKKYIDIASTVMGTPAKEYSAKVRNPAALRSPTSPHDGSTASALLVDESADSTSCTSPAGNVASANNIAQTAVNFSWPEKHSPPKTPKPEYAAAISQYNGGQRKDGADCGVFVATVMRASGADPNYPPIGTAVQRDYVRSHPEKYTIIENPSSTADLQPGDVLVVNNGSRHHTLIYVGPQGGAKNFDQASASQDSRSANLGKIGWEKNLSIYTVARLK